MVQHNPCPSHETIFQQLHHVRKGASVCMALHSQSGFFGSNSEIRTQRWWRLHELLGEEASFTTKYDSGSPEAEFQWLNETVPLQEFGLRRNLFGFMTRHHPEPDRAALDLAKRTHKQLYDVFLPISDPDPPWLGLGDPKRFKAGSLPTMNACRHIMMMVFLMHLIPEDERRAGLRVLEVGGGYGNMARMALLAGAETVNVRRWTVFDMRQSGLVQEWFLRNTLHHGTRSRDVATSSANVTIRSTREIASSSGADISAFFESVVEPQVTLVDTSHFHSWAAAAFHMAPSAPVDGRLIAIGTHSWSELPWETFCQYFNAIAGRATYILYATQRHWPSTALVNRKLAMFRTMYDPLLEVPTEHGATLNVVFLLKGLSGA